MNNMMTGMLLRFPLVGKLIGRTLIPEVRDMFDGMDMRDNYLDELIRAKKTEIQHTTDEISDGYRF